MTVSSGILVADCYVQAIKDVTSFNPLCRPEPVSQPANQHSSLFEHGWHGGTLACVCIETRKDEPTSILLGKMMMQSPRDGATNKKYVMYVFRLFATRRCWRTGNRMGKKKKKAKKRSISKEHKYDHYIISSTPHRPTLSSPPFFLLLFRFVYPRFLFGLVTYFSDG